MTHPLEKLQDPLQRLGEACRQTGDALVKLVQAAADFAAVILQGVDTAQLLKIVKEQAALKEAPPRVKHLAEHSKKHRTRKKNINRALREYQRRHQDYAGTLL